MLIHNCVLRMTDLDIFNHDGEGNVVESKVLLHRDQTEAGHSDVHRELSGDWVKPEVHL